MSGKLNKPIMLRLSEEVVESVELAAKAEGLIIQDWIRKAIDYYLINMTNTCPKCRTYNSRDSRYCKKCGEKLTNIPQRMV